MVRAVAFALVLAACSHEASPADEAAEHEDGMAASSHASDATETHASRSSGRTDSSSSAPVFCAALSPCCAYSDDQAAPPPNCPQVAASGDNVLCGLSLEAIQGVYAGPNGIILSGDSECGPCDMNAYPPISEAACLALNACAPTIGDVADSETATLVAAINFEKPCDSALAYFESKGYCASVAFDAGTWTGLPPPATNYTGGSGGHGGSASN